MSGAYRWNRHDVSFLLPRLRPWFIACRLWSASVDVEVDVDVGIEVSAEVSAEVGVWGAAGISDNSISDSVRVAVGVAVANGQPGQWNS